MRGQIIYSIIYAHIKNLWEKKEEQRACVYALVEKLFGRKRERRKPVSRVAARDGFHLRDDSRPVGLFGEIDSHVDTIPVQCLDRSDTLVCNGAPFVPCVIGSGGGGGGWGDEGNTGYR